MLLSSHLTGRMEDTGSSQGEGNLEDEGARVKGTIRMMLNNLTMFFFQGIELKQGNIMSRESSTFISGHWKAKRHQRTLPGRKLQNTQLKSIAMFEEIATYSIKNNLLKYGVRGLLLNACVCQLCRGDILDTTFSGMCECKFLM
ncbi:hypothetical protein H5410_063884, partial [Solanum commersonii]